VAAASAAVGTVTAAEEKPLATAKCIKILAIGCSPKEQSSTAAALQVCLDAAKAVDPEHIEVELIKLAGLKINGNVAAGIPLEPGERDDFPALVPKLTDPAVAGIIIGSPVYFSNMSSLCKAFLERLMTCRQANFALSNKVGGVLAVGGGRNGGQELTIKSIQTSLFSQEMIVVGETRPTSHFGPGVWNNKDFGEVTKDEVGMAAVKALGRRVAEVARLVHR